MLLSALSPAATRNAVRNAAAPSRAGSMVSLAPCLRSPSTRIAFLTRSAAVESTSSYKEAVATPVLSNGELSAFPGTPGIYAVMNQAGELQYVGLARKMSASIANHVAELPELTHFVKVLALPSGTRDTLTAAWKAWIEEAVSETGSIPPGNAPGETKWQARTVKPVKPEIRLTAGKPISGITIEGLIDQVVKTNKVVAFVKGTRTEPGCGFSRQMMMTLNEFRADYEVVNVLDDIHNPGLRDAIKVYSEWPTIPQLYIAGEFVGGADIVLQMASNGELKTLLAASKQ